MAPPSDRPRDPTGKAHQVVLLVDDEPEITRLLKEHLERALAVTVVEVTSGAEALSILREHQVDLIITDQTMPGMTGTEFLAKASELSPSVPRAMLTHEHDLGLAVHALNDLNIAAFYPKPVETSKFIASVKSVLARKRAIDTRDAGFAQASRVFRHESTLRGGNVPATPFIGPLTNDDEDEQGRRSG